MNATRPPDSTSRRLIRSPTQALSTGTSASRMVPLGSRHSGSEPWGSSRRIIWSAVQRTVATVGMPRRW